MSCFSKWQGHVMISAQHISFILISVPIPLSLSLYFSYVTTSELQNWTMLRLISSHTLRHPPEFATWILLHTGQQDISNRTTHLFLHPFPEMPHTLHRKCMPSSRWPNKTMMLTVCCILLKASTGLHRRYSMNCRLRLSHEGSLIGNLQQSCAT